MAKANRVAKPSPSKTSKVNRAKTAKGKNNNAVHDELLFDKDNYKWMLIGLGLIVLGFILMYGKNDIYSTVKITIAPLMVLAGIVVEVYAIMKKQKGEEPITESELGANNDVTENN